MSSSKHLSFDPETNILIVEDVPGLEYLIGNKVVTGEVKLKRDTIVRVRGRGKVLKKGSPTEFEFRLNVTPDDDVDPDDVGDSNNEVPTEENTNPFGNVGNGEL